MAQITSITSEALQAKIRELLPSQQGFGEDLQASNVILPIIDLTAAAQGTSTPISMQQAIAFGSMTAFDAASSTVALANTPGFYRIFGVAVTNGSGAATYSSAFTMSDGLSTKTIWKANVRQAGTSFGSGQVQFDFIVFLASGESISAVASDGASMVGSYRQIANVNGDLVNPSGFTPQ